MADERPQGVELRAAHFVILEQHFFDLLHLARCLSEPGADGVLLDSFDAFDRGQRVAVGQHREAFEDRFLVVLFAVKNCPFGFSEDLFAGRALPALAPFSRQAVSAQVSGVHTPPISASGVSAEGAWMS